MKDCLLGTVSVPTRELLIRRSGKDAATFHCDLCAYRQPGGQLGARGHLWPGGSCPRVPWRARCALRRYDLFNFASSLSYFRKSLPSWVMKPLEEKPPENPLRIFSSVGTCVVLLNLCCVAFKEFVPGLPCVVLVFCRFF